MLAPVKGISPVACAQGWQWARGGIATWPSADVEGFCAATDRLGNVYGGALYDISSFGTVDFGGGVTAPATSA